MKCLWFRLSYSLLVSLALLCVGANVRPALAQDDKPVGTANKSEEINLDTQLYLVIGTNQEVGNEKLPSGLDQVVKSLRGSLPFKNYSLAATLINRVRSEGHLSLRWIGGPLLASAGAASGNSPTFNDFKINSVKVVSDAQGHKVIRMDGFNFGSRVPIVTYNSGGPLTGPASPVTSYEGTGLTSDISMREGEPVVVGTLNLGPSGDAIILVMSARRAM